MVYVIGSGPAGISCSMALLDRGADVTLLDTGLEIEPQQAQAVRNIRQLPPESWTGPNVQSIQHGFQADRKGLGRKFVFGSDFPYRGVDQFMPLRPTGVDTTASLARGGFSNVWGAMVLPYLQSDIHDWPITSADLAPHYRAVLQWMDISACRDGLEELFPLHCDNPDALRLSAQSSAFLADMDKNRDVLRSAGLFFGRSRLAVRTKARGSQPGCVYCKLCLYGCPYELIYNSADTLDRLLRDGRLRYVKGIFVNRLTEKPGHVAIDAADSDGRQIQFQADRVFVACGPVSTTRLMLRSLSAYNQPVRMEDSHYFLLPFLRFSAPPRVADEAMFTLGQLLIEILDPQVCQPAVHLQVYSYNDLYASAIKKMLGPASGLLSPLTNGLLARLLMFQGYLHSRHSPGLNLTLTKPETGPDTLLLESSPNDSTDLIMHKVVAKLKSHWRQLRGLPVSAMMNRPSAGRGFHSGGTFPMSDSPRGFQTDVAGRPAGMRRVHLVDSSVFPSIPATTITFSIMANAHRIGSLYGQL